MVKYAMKLTLLRGIGVAIAVAALVLLILRWPFIQHWLAVHTGTLNEPGPYYGFWSGFGSDLGEAAIIGGIAGALRKHNCHVKGCLRLGKHQVEGTPYIVCAKHHPDVPEGGASLAHIHRMHHEHKERQRKAA